MKTSGPSGLAKPRGPPSGTARYVLFRRFEFVGNLSSLEKRYLKYPRRGGASPPPRGLHCAPGRCSGISGNRQEQHWFDGILHRGFIWNDSPASMVWREPCAVQFVAVAFEAGVDRGIWACPFLCGASYALTLGYRVDSRRYIAAADLLPGGADRRAAWWSACRYACRDAGRTDW